MYKTFLSWRYIITRPTNILAILGIMLGCGAMITILAIMTGFLEESRSVVRGNLSDLIIEPVSALVEESPGQPRRPDEILAHVRADDRVAGACAHLTWGGIVIDQAGMINMRRASGQAMPFVQLIGVDYEEEVTATQFAKYLEEPPTVRYGGSHVTDPEHPFEPQEWYDGDEPWGWAVVGEQLAYMHRLKRGDVLNVATVLQNVSTGEWAQSNRKFVVAGTFRSTVNEIDTTRIYLDRRELADFLGDSMLYTQVLVRTTDYEEHGEALRDDLARELFAAGLTDRPLYREVSTWEDQRRNMLAAIANERVLLGIMLSLVMAVAGFTVAAILSMLVTEKRRDIGILTALGATPVGVTKLFLLIGVWDGLLGGALELWRVRLFALNVDAIESQLSSTFGWQIFDRTIYIFDYIPATVVPLHVAIILAGTFVSTLLSSLIPAWRAGRLHPIDALRYE